MALARAMARFNADRGLPHALMDAQSAAQLRDRIFDGELLPGSFLDEASLAVQMRISRTPLREALKVLTAEGLVRHEPRRGSFVNEVTEQDLNEIFPVITLLGTQLPLILGGTVVIETIFGLPGVSRFLFDAINQRDYALVQGTVLFIAFNFLVVNLLVDLAYAALDPRIRLGNR